MRRMTSWSLSLVLLLATGCVTADDNVVVIELLQYRFVPAEVTIKRGTTVRWVNMEKRQFHSVWFRDAGEEPIDYLFPGDTYERKFDTVGEFPYVCEPHEDEMHGLIRVVE